MRDWKDCMGKKDKRPRFFDGMDKLDSLNCDLRGNEPYTIFKWTSRNKQAKIF